MNTIVGQMSIYLASCEVALSDADAVTQALVGARYTLREIEDHMKDAVATAKMLRNSRAMSEMFAQIRRAS